MANTLPAGWDIQVGETEAHYLARLRTAFVSSDARVNDPLAAQVQGYYFTQLHGWNVAIQQARQRDDVATVQALLPRYQLTLERYRAAGAGQLDLSGFDQFLLAMQQWVKASAQAFTDLSLETFKVLFNAAFPWLLVGAVVIILFRPDVVRNVKRVLS